MWECVMLICFGASWPPAIAKTIRVKNPQGKSFVFMLLVLIGYLSGIIGKAIAFGDEYQKHWVFWLYVLDFGMVATDFLLCAYYQRRNRLRALHE